MAYGGVPLDSHDFVFEIDGDLEFPHLRHPCHVNDTLGCAC